MKGEQNNCVIIHIWTSAHNKTRSGVDVGHVSIEIPAFQQPGKPGSGYYSLWPNLIERQWTGYIDPVPGFYMKGYRRPGTVTPPSPGAMNAYDCDAEGRDAEITVCLYHLDIYKINARFEALRIDVDSWVLVGKNILRPLKPNNACSCSSLAKDLLVAGGVNELISSAASSTWSSAATPDAFVQIEVSAKKAEHIA